MKGYIYKIVNKTNGNFYIGSTFNPQDREKKHFNDLRLGTHHSIFLQRAYNLYGKDSFYFAVVRELDFDNEMELRMLEERYIQFCWKSGKLYNVSKMGSGGDLVSYHPLINEIKAKQSKATKEKWESKTEDEKLEYSNKMRGRGNPNFGNKWTKEQKEKASEYWKNYYLTHERQTRGKKLEEICGKERADKIKRILSEQASQRTGEKNPFYGKKHSKATKEKLAMAHLGKLPVNSKKVEYNGTIYDSAGECAKALKMSHMTVCYRCRNNLYGFKYV